MNVIIAAPTALETSEPQPQRPIHLPTSDQLVQL